MDLDSKLILRSTIEDYLRTEHPNRVSEFQIVFDDVCDLLVASPLDFPENGEATNTSGICFDASSIADPVISLSIVAGAMLVSVATKAVTSDDLTNRLRQLEVKLTSFFGHPALIKQIRQRVQRVFEDV